MAGRPRLPGMAAHEATRVESDEWLTPRWLVGALGTFDLDPCAHPAQRERPHARRIFTREEDGLNQDWEGRVWLNPPYSEIADWMCRLAEHGDGIALVFARTETRWWFDYVWPHASGILYLRGRLTFDRPDGQRIPRGHATAPAVLIAYGPENLAALGLSKIPGALCGSALWVR